MSKKISTLKKRFLGILFSLFFLAFAIVPFSLNISPPFGTKVQQKIMTGLPLWAKEQINSDLQNYPKVSKEALEQLYNINKGKLLLWCKIKDKKIDFQTHCPQHIRIITYCRNLQNLAQNTPLPNCEFLIFLQDCVEEITPLAENPKYLPIFVFAKKRNNTAILIPDFEAFDGYNICKHHLTQKILKAHKKYPWNKKIDKVFWRGATTGGNFTEAGWQTLPRSRLVLLSAKHPNDIDAYFHYLAQCTPECAKTITSMHLLNTYLLPKDHLAFRYLIDVDGNSCTYSRCVWILFSNSLLIKQKSDNVQWYYKGLKAYEHYIPVDNDISNLMDVLKWLRKNDKIAERISKNANNFAKQNLSQEANFAYFAQLLQDYAQRYSSSKTL